MIAYPVETIAGYFPRELQREGTTVINGETWGVWRVRGCNRRVMVRLTPEQVAALALRDAMTSTPRPAA